MKRHLLARLLGLCTVLLLLLSIPLSSLADFGGFSGDTDWGGSSDFGDSFDFGDDDIDFGSSTIIGGSSLFDDDDYYDDGSSGGTSIIFIAIVIIVIITILRSKKSGTSGSAKRVTVNIQETVATHSIDELKAIDPNFSDEALKEKISNLYVQMQNCWQAKDISPLRNSMTDAFYNQADRQIQALKSNNQTNMIENIAVLSVNLMGYNEDDTNTTIIAKLNTRIVDYVVDDKTGNVIKGSKTAEKFMTYEWLLIRSKGALTGANEGTTAVHCPSCGAPMNVNFSAKCEFCGTVIKQAEYDWVLSNIKGLSQTTV